MTARRGVALLLVLWVLAILGGLSATIMAAGRSRVDAAANLVVATEARLAAESGVVAAVRELEDSIGALRDARRRAYLDALDQALSLRGEVPLGELRFQVTLVDASARLDINDTPEEALSRFFTQFAPAPRAQAIARAIRARIGEGQPGTPARPIRDLDELRQLAPMDARVARAAAPYLTVDGDGRINARVASPQVRMAAGGELVDEPSRIVVVSRGWRPGRALTVEIQAVYAIQGSQLALVRWRERTL